MAEKSGKKGGNKKAKSEKISLADFHILDQIESVDDWTVELPTVPRALREAVIDYDSLPSSAPFLLVVDNAPFDVLMDVLAKYFANCRYKEILPNVEFGKRRAPTIEFETRDDMIRTVQEKYNTEIGNRIIHLKSLQEMNSRGGEMMRRNTDNRHDDRRDQDPANRGGEPVPEDGMWRRDDRPSPPSSMPDNRRAGFNHRVDNRGGDFEFKRNMDNVPVERAPSQPFVRRDSRDEGRQGGGYDGRSDNFGGRDSAGRSAYGVEPPPGYDPRPPRQDNRPDFQPRLGGYGRDMPEQNRGRYSQQSSRDGPPNFERNNSRNNPDLIIQRSSYIPPPQPPRIPAPPPTTVQQPDQVPPARQKLQLDPRSTPIEATPAPAPSSSSIFGQARPVDTARKYQEVEERLKQEAAQKEAARLAKEKESAEGGPNATAPTQLLTHKGPAALHSSSHDQHSQHRTEALVKATAQLHLHNNQRRDTRPVASVLPLRNESANAPPTSRDVRNDKSFQQSSQPRGDQHAYPQLKHPEPDRALHTSNRYAAVALLQDQEGGQEDHSEEAMTLQPPKDADEAVREDLGAESDASSSGFQVVGNKRQQRPSAPQYTRVFHNRGRGGAGRGGPSSGAMRRSEAGSDQQRRGGPPANYNTRRPDVGVGQAWDK